MFKINKLTPIGSYEIDFYGSNDGAGGRLKFSQSSSSGNIEQIVNTQDWSHKLRDRNFKKLKVIEERYQLELGSIVEDFQNKCRELMGIISEELESLE